MAAQYHINRKTLRANICHAPVGECPLGPREPHFPSKEAAQARLEKVANMALGQLPAPKRPDRRTRAKVEPLTEGQRTLATIFTGGGGVPNVDKMQSDISLHLGDSAVRRQSICGFTGAGECNNGGYCTCSVYTGKFDVGTEELALDLLVYSWGDRSNRVMGPPVKEAARELSNLMRAHHMAVDDYVAQGVPGYYGEELDKVEYQGDEENLSRFRDSLLQIMERVSDGGTTPGT